jgi:hypothetical protein
MGPVRKNFVIPGWRQPTSSVSQRNAAETSVDTAGRVTLIYAVATFRTARVAASLSW